MSTRRPAPLALLAGLAAIAVTAVIAFSVFPPRSQPVVAGPVATPSATMEATANSPFLTIAPSPSPSPRGSASAIGLLAAGTYHSVNFEPELSFEVPTGWAQLSDEADAYVFRGPGPARGVYCPDTGPKWGESCRAHANDILVSVNPVLASDAGNCEGLALTGAPRSVDGMVAALRADRRFIVGPSRLVSIGGMAGQEFVIQLAWDWTATCKWSVPLRGALVLTTAHPPGPFIGLSGLEKLNMILLESAAGTVLISLEPAETRRDPKATFADARSVIDTFQFGR
jgi:hypothetical protein